MLTKPRVLVGQGEENAKSDLSIYGEKVIFVVVIRYIILLAIPLLFVTV